MATYKILSIDESGKASYNHPSKEFALMGVVINEKFKPKLFSKLQKIKARYFKDSEIVLHYSEISRKRNVFSVLRDKGIEVKFWCDILAILNNSNISYLFTLVDKANSQKANWLDKTIVHKSYLSLIKMYVCSLQRNEKGKIITESDCFQDTYLAKVHNTYQAQGIKECNLTGRGYWEKITCLSFVNKRNLDPEIELADLLGSSIRLKYRLEYKKSKEKINNVERKKLRFINRKVHKDNSNFLILR
ncbi:hypothetical protein L6255_04400 [Candidatus Parcubacteria bacterium]|nr:hypothetical protein [Patescibacteria group bacterium]MBU4380733.1 hypothetical protein [Patescibacteria group bacterium]MCG2689650.1 hypothetical protein [Candidatus Parcubacteria bacterium]